MAKQTQKPKYEHTYPYPCTFLGTFMVGGNIKDLYHTKTFDGVTLLCRYGNKSLEFYGESLDYAKSYKDEPDSMVGECWRRAEKMGLQLVNDKK